MKVKVKPSYIIALVLAVSAAGWVYSGQMEQDPFAPAPDAAVGATSPAETHAERALPAVRVAQSIASNHRAILLYTGRTEAERRSVLSAETDGRVIEIGAEKSQPVAEGDVIVKLTTADRYARLKEAEALVRQRTIEYDAAKSLAGKGFQSESAKAAAEANLTAAKAQLETIRVDINRTVIKAPFDGVVEVRPVQIGDYVRPGDQIAQIADLNPIVVTIQVTEREIGKVQLGILAEIELLAKQRFTGMVSRIATAADKNTRTFEVELEVENPDLTLLDGMTAKVNLPSQEVKAHKVTPALLALDNEGRVGVKAVDADNRVVFYPITIVEDTASGMWVGGLPDELTLITVGQAFVAPGALVTPVPEGAIAPVSEPQTEPGPTPELSSTDTVGDNS